MVTRIKLVLEQPEYSALLKLAERELRSPAEQARFVLREKLVSRGLLSAEATQRPLQPAGASA